jgi:hypothetical protein
MSSNHLLQEFFEAISHDVRVSPVHVSLYSALLSSCMVAGCTNPFPIDRSIIMQKARILARMTYNKSMNELQHFGFIKYIPSVNQFLESIVYLLDPDEKMSAIIKEIAENTNCSYGNK